MTIETLANGMRLIYERIPHFRSVSAGVWVGAGSADERPEQGGLSHVLEHMVFKGTEKYTAAGLAFAMDSVGGNINAYTSKELTCYYAKVADEHMPLAIDVLHQLVMKPRLDPQDMERELQVILEEISMIEDTPEDLVHDMMGEAFFGAHPLARPISSTAQIVEAYGIDDVRGYYEQAYSPANMVISVAGNFDEAQLKDQVSRLFGSFGPGQPVIARPEMHAPDGAGRIALRIRDFEQSHLCIGLRGYTSGSDDVYPTMILNNILGGSMSSRLFQRMREEEGLVYSVYSYPAAFRASGMFGVYAAMKPDNTAMAMQIIAQEINSVARGDISAEEFQRAKEQLKGNYALSQDGVSQRMSSMGKNLLLHNRTMSEHETMDKINAVTFDDLCRVSQYIGDIDHLAGAAVGRFDDEGQMSRLLRMQE